MSSISSLATTTQTVQQISREFLYTVLGLFVLLNFIDSVRADTVVITLDYYLLLYPAILSATIIFVTSQNILKLKTAVLTHTSFIIKLGVSMLVFMIVYFSLPTASGIVKNLLSLVVATIVFSLTLKINVDEKFYET